MMSSPHQQQEDVVLPEPVEQCIKRICIDKNQTGLKVYARKMLAGIGEQASVEILNTIISSKTPIRSSFSGYVSTLVKKDYPEQADAVLSFCSPSSASPLKPSGEGLQSLLSSFRANSSSSSDAGERVVSPQLLVLNKLEYRKLFLVLRYIRSDSGHISGKVLVYKNPGIHFGDVHVMEAVYVKRLEEFVGNAKYGIFFSTKGHMSAAYEMATGDFDGDRY